MKLQKARHMKRSLTLLSIFALTACTQGTKVNNADVSRSFATVDVNTKIDMLFVVDNSASMDVAQEKLRDGLQAFANSYLKPTWDIQIAVIPSDAYLANSAFSGYLATEYLSYDGSRLRSNYLGNNYQSLSAAKQALLPFIDVANSVFNNANTALNYAKYNNLFTFNRLVPSWGPNYAAPIDGPVAGLCVEQLPYFSAADVGGNPVVGPKCKTRDMSAVFVNASDCTDAVGDDSITQCLNTVLNDTVHSGTKILKTPIDSGFSADPLDPASRSNQWIAKLVKNFKINASSGVTGNGSERPFESVKQFLIDNEGYTTQAPRADTLFRANSTRVIVFITDEDDQSQTIPANPPAGFTPFSNYTCDPQALVAANLFRYPVNGTTILTDADRRQATWDWVSGKRTGAATVGTYAGAFYCCNSNRYADNDPLAECTFTIDGTYDPATDAQTGGCSATTLDGTSVKVSSCPLASSLRAPSDFKDDFDAFFTDLDGGDAAKAKQSYFVANIIPNTAATYNSLVTSRTDDDERIGTSVTKRPIDSGSRLRVLANAVGNGSLTMDMGAASYATLLDSIGQQIIDKKSRFDVGRTPTDMSTVIVKVLHSDGTETVIDSSKYTFSGTTLIITDQNTVLGLQVGDRIWVLLNPTDSFDS